MRYLSIDVETSGLAIGPCKLLEIAMVLEDTACKQPVEELPYFHAYVRHAGGVWWEPKAFAMHYGKPVMAYQMDKSADGYFYSNGLIHESLDKMVDAAIAWLDSYRSYGSEPNVGKFTVAGKNFSSFDRFFIPDRLMEHFERRVIDAGSVLVDWNQARIQSLAELKGSEVAHDALEDARDVIRVLRRSYS